jgi:hypothetical protein
MINFYAVAAAPFGAIEPLIRLPVEFAERNLPLERRAAYTDGQSVLLAGRSKFRCVHRSAYPLRHDFRRGQPHSRQKYAEFLSAQPPDEIGFTHNLADRPRDDLQSFVPRSCPKLSLIALK